MNGRCISQNELAKRWQISEATLERWRSQLKGSQFLRLGGQVRYRLADVEAYELEKMEANASLLYFLAIFIHLFKLTVFNQLRNLFV